MTEMATGLKSPAEKVLDQLREGPRTVDDIAAALRITPNAVRDQLRKLQDRKLAVRKGSRPGASKPSALYEITLEGQAQFSTIYLPVLTHFLLVAEGKCSGKQLDSFMLDTGKSLAKRFPAAKGNASRRAHAAARLLRSFGGVPEVRPSNGTLVIESVACPLATLTSQNASACKIMEGLLAEFMASPVRNCCVHGSKPRCCFEVPAESR